MRSVTQAGAVAPLGFVATVAAGSLAVAGLDRLSPDAPSSPLGVLRRAIGLGLTGLLVPTESGDVAGLVAPLTAGVVTVWAIAWGIRARVDRSALSRPPAVVVGTTFAGLCAGGAALADTPGMHVPVAWAALAGFVWGIAGALAGSAAPGAARWKHGHVALAGKGAPGAAPWMRGPLTLVRVAAVVSAAWLLGLGVVSIAAGSLDLDKAAGVFLLAIAYAPNLLAALVALGCGARVEAVVYGYGDQGVALWDWSGGAAPWFVILLVAAPLAATVAAASRSQGDTLRTGLVNGLVLGASLAVVGWVGSFEVSGGGPGRGAGMRLGIDLAPAFVLGVAWGVAGAYLARVAPMTLGRPRVGRP